MCIEETYIFIKNIASMLAKTLSLLIVQLLITHVIEGIQNIFSLPFSLKLFPSVSYHRAMLN